MTTDKLRSYFVWLITPHTDKEQFNFGKCVDSYIYLKPKISTMKRDELIKLINLYLEEYDLQLSL